MIYSFGEYELDTQRFELRRDGDACRLEPQVFDVLAYLLRHRDRMVTRDELFEKVWPGRVVSDSALSNRIMAARKAVGDSGHQQRHILTVHGRGFRFVGPVEERSTGTERRGALRLFPVITDAAREGRQQMRFYGEAHSLSPVGREAELGRLHRWLDEALQRARRQIVFITGETGVGKTTLVETFLQEASRRAELWIGQGQCLNYRGAGEAYMPVLEAFGRICRGPGGGDVIELLVRHAPTWLVQMPGLVEVDDVQALQQRVNGASRERMVREMVEAVEVLTTRKPLVLVLEDLHWSDYATLDLIARMAQRQEPARLLLLGTYRPADALQEGHPLYGLQYQLSLHGQSSELPLGLLDEAAVEAYLQERFSDADVSAKLAVLVYARTDGNPLFMTRLVDYWISEGLLSRTDGRWSVQEMSDAVVQAVPESLRQLVEQQLRLLSPEDQAVLEAASVAGMAFSAATVAAGLERPEEEAEERCATLARREQFLHAGGIANWPDGTVAARFRFMHHLYQEVLYERVPAGQRRRLHHRIGRRLETGYGAEARDRAVELAVHFTRGYDHARAVEYLQAAADQAVQRGAHREAIAHLQAALELFVPLPETTERLRSELALQAALGSALVKIQGWSSKEAEQAFLRARVLSEQLGGTPELLSILYELAVLYEYRGAFEASQALMNHRLRLAQGDYLPEAHELLACSTFYQGKFNRSLEHAREGLSIYEAEEPGSEPGFWGHNSGVLCRDWAALALWFLGYPDRARQEADEALRLAEVPENAHSVSNVQMKTAILHQCLLEAEKTEAHAGTTVAVATRQGFTYRVAVGMILEGWAWAVLGRHQEGLARIEKGLEIHKKTGASMDRPYFLGLLATACSVGGDGEAGLEALEEALEMVARSRTFFFEAELYRLQGNLLAQTKADRDEVEACFHRAIEVARHQQAKSLELRAAMTLARLWQKQGQQERARTLLWPIYHSFAEGFDTHDLVAARALLGALTGGAPITT